MHRHGPFLRDVAQRQVEQFEDRLIVGKRAARFRHFAQRHVQRLNRVGRVDHLPNLRRVREERNHARPVAAPGLRNRGKLRIPLQAKLSQSLFGFRFGRGGVDRLQVRRHFLALFPAHIVQRVPHQMHDAQLHFGLRKDTLNRFGKTFQPVHAGDKDVFYAAIL